VQWNIIYKNSKRECFHNLQTKPRHKTWQWFITIMSFGQFCSPQIRNILVIDVISIQWKEHYVQNSIIRPQSSFIQRKYIANCVFILPKRHIPCSCVKYLGRILWGRSERPWYLRLIHCSQYKICGMKKTVVITAMDSSTGMSYRVIIAHNNYVKIVRSFFPCWVLIRRNLCFNL